MRRNPFIAVACAAAVYFLAIPFVFRGSPYVLSVLTNAAIAAVVVIGRVADVRDRAHQHRPGRVLHDRRLPPPFSRRATACPFWLCLPLSGAGRRRRSVR